MEFRYPDKRVQICWSVYTVSVTCVPATIGIWLTFIPSLPRWCAVSFNALWCALLLFLLTVYFPRRRKGLRYRVEQSGITVIGGVLTVTRRYIPLSAVRCVIALRGPLERAFGLSTLLVCAAGGRLLIEGIPVADAEALTEKLL
ncbi:MAG: PH domain-containing protein [Clostridia bacterium]|nr:PH domain-containing protein [Clostridia bacterium]